MTKQEALQTIVDSFTETHDLGERATQAIEAKALGATFDELTDLMFIQNDAEAPSPEVKADQIALALAAPGNGLLRFYKAILG